MIILSNQLQYWGLAAMLLLLLISTSHASHIIVDIHSDVGLFYEELAHHGDWVESDKGEFLWIPTATPADWRPYTIGQWAYDQANGWVWLSGWSWGWAPFHYGRWMFHPEYGWAWKPGTQWAPAWVAWRSSNEVIGWAPLSPAFELNNGETMLNDQQLESIDLYSWSFVPAKKIFSSNLHAKAIIMAGRNPTLLAQTHSESRYKVSDAGIFNVGIDPLQLFDESSPTLRLVSLVDVTFPDAVAMTHVGENQAAIFRPTIDLNSELSPPAPSLNYQHYNAAELAKSHKNILSALNIYHQAEDKSMAKIHKQQLVEVTEGEKVQLIQQQQNELDSLDILHKREQEVILKRFEREKHHLSK